VNYRLIKKGASKQIKLFLLQYTINLWAFPLVNESIISCYCINSCMLLCVDVVYYSYGVNGKVRAEKYEDIATKQGYWIQVWFLWYKINVMNVYFLKKVVSRKIEKVLQDDCQIRRIMSVVCLTLIHCHSLTAANYIWINKVLNVN